MSKINKLGKSTFVIAILSFLLVAVLAFGGTYAYFTAKSQNVSGTFKTGHLRITSISKGTGESDTMTITNVVVPGQTDIYGDGATVTTTVNTNIDFFTRVKFNVTVEPKGGDDHKHYHTTEASCKDYLAPNEYHKILNFEIGADWEAEGTADYASEVIFYNLKRTEATSDVTAGNEEVTFTFNADLAPWLGANGVTGEEAFGCPFWMDATITVTVTVEVLQADYVADTDLTAGNFTDVGKCADAWEAALAVPKS